MKDKFPAYRSHKVVSAAVIYRVGSHHLDLMQPEDYDVVNTFPVTDGEAVNNLEYHSYGISDPSTFFARYRPVPGDFLVFYPDGYISISPRQAFLDGYGQCSFRPVDFSALPEEEPDL